MGKYILFVDNSSSSKDVERELEVRGINFLRIEEDGLGRVLPTISGPKGIFEGTANIHTYFLRYFKTGHSIKPAAIQSSIEP